MIHQRVRASAQVEAVSDREAMPHRHPGFILDKYPPPMFRVEVWGEPPHGYTRTYYVAAKSDYQAAFEGIRRFTEEMESPPLRKVI